VSLETYGWLILIFPLAGCVVISLGFAVFPGKLPGWIGTLAIALSFAASVGALFSLLDRGHEERRVVTVGWDYAVTSRADAELSLLLDPLSIFMALVVSGVSMLIHLYSVSYMASDRGYARFFSYLNFFVFSMLLLVLAGNFLLLIVGWAFVGAASYLLISFWFRRTTATQAGIKAFVINVVGDVGLVIGTYFIFKGSGSLDLLKTFEAVPDAFERNDSDLVWGCIGLLVGAFAKSAQVPLHTWLPDAMEGPTPVSALIHAATMVTAGVYLIARMHPLFEQAPTAADVGAIIGCATLLIAGTIGLAVTDLKRVIAYSTMSQIGYMVLGVASAAYAAGLFHLMTHAFFKALLFMAAGSLIAAMAGTQDLDRMGGFRRAMPFTFACFVIGGLALSGFPGLSGYFSKDEILALVAARGDWHVILAVLGFVGSLLTAIYTFRMIFRAFWGEPVEPARELEHGHLYHAPEPTNPATGEVEDTDVGFPGPEHHIAEREGSMKVAMGALAVLSVVGGVLQIPEVTNVLHDFLEPTFAESRFYEELEPSGGLTVLSLLTGATLGLLGIWLAYQLWVRDPSRPAALRARLAGVHRVFVNKWYFDEILDRLVVRPFAWFGRFARDTFERLVINGVFVGGVTGAVRAGSAAVRAVQSGYLRYYAALLLLGLTALGLYFLVAAG
jgi:NADH-quinone oxidoreductase subunit L